MAALRLMTKRFPVDYTLLQFVTNIKIQKCQLFSLLLKTLLSELLLMQPDKVRVE